ncbi:hypothetical protein BkAM31D_07295 [Halalkalibacter krulwichiae]|jgi:hypothetical protein|uniref:Uncharacterized protein n=1 Tax=Halalkalibacter krulwichiae TaxID=199441 RepID=A0A1X9MAQ6_9BACI|nr:hypothetical protein BkAM31D_07295 [Halalkalibacter krulwichiae]QHM08289.1 hypothetical protein C7M27_04314 [Bacillus subtilis]CAI9395458.1 hypothetical protein BACSP_04098 [Bacillus sp. T2.9-1]SDX73614.1 hypothetical protein SAMN05518848_11318 [Paenibacillus sp. PDC88]SFS89389.1 hypothetical protein SAMN04488601_106139 [Paenibacillus sp. 453mf]
MKRFTMPRDLFYGEGSPIEAAKLNLIERGSNV